MRPLSRTTPMRCDVLPSSCRNSSSSRFISEASCLARRGSSFVPTSLASCLHPVHPERDGDLVFQLGAGLAGFCHHQRASFDVIERPLCLLAVARRNVLELGG